MHTTDVVGKVMVEADVTVEMVDNMLCTAFDGGLGGCWYWADYIEVSTPGKEKCDYMYEVVARGGTLKVVDKEPEDDGSYPTYYLDLEKYLLGIRDACRNYGKTPERLYEDDDADSADVIVQFALFGEIVYG